MKYKTIVVKVESTSVMCKILQIVDDNYKLRQKDGYWIVIAKYTSNAMLELRKLQKHIKNFYLYPVSKSEE